MARWVTRASVAAALVSVTSLTGGCRALYVTRVGIQHLRYMSRARPIADEIERTTDDDRRRKLELVLAARRWGKDNGLDPGGSYLEVSDTEGLATGYVVTAAYADRLEPYQWHYPIVGDIPYRGYFDPEAARAFADDLASEGYDTYVFEAAGYSTLGWLDDPLPSSLLDADEVTIVDVVLHEIVHQTVYVKSQIAFNESLASAVSKRLTEAFFAARGEQADAETAARRLASWLAESVIFDDVQEKLDAYFAASAGLPRQALLDGRGEIYDDLARRLAKLGLEPPSNLNNAVFLALYRYRAHAGLLDRYIASFDSMAPAIADVRERTSESDVDPYAALNLAPAAAPCLF